VDSPHGGGKVPIMPNYIVSASNDAVILRNYEGMLIRYQAEDRSPAPSISTATQGVSALLQGDRTALVPEHTERLQRRRLIRLDAAHSPGAAGKREAMNPTEAHGDGHIPDHQGAPRVSPPNQEAAAEGFDRAANLIDTSVAEDPKSDAELVLG